MEPRDPQHSCPPHDVLEKAAREQYAEERDAQRAAQLLGAERAWLGSGYLPNGVPVLGGAEKCFKAPPPR